jgi:hypothetical protein
MVQPKIKTTISLAVQYPTPCLIFTFSRSPLTPLCVNENILTSVVDPDLHESALIWLFWIRNRIRNADPDPGPWNRPN